VNVGDGRAGRVEARFGADFQFPGQRALFGVQFEVRIVRETELAVAWALMVEKAAASKPVRSVFMMSLGGLIFSLEGMYTGFEEAHP